MNFNHSIQPFARSRQFLGGLGIRTRFASLPRRFPVDPHLLDRVRAHVTRYHD